jgi:hypothetical protein
MFATHTTNAIASAESELIDFGLSKFLEPGDKLRSCQYLPSKRFTSLDVGCISCLVYLGP